MSSTRRRESRHGGRSKLWQWLNNETCANATVVQSQAAFPKGGVEKTYKVFCVWLHDGNSPVIVIIRSDVYLHFRNGMVGNTWLTMSVFEYYIHIVTWEFLLFSRRLFLLNMVMHMMLALPILQYRLHAGAVLHLHAMKMYLKHLPMQLINVHRHQSVGKKSRSINLISPNQII